MSAEKNVSVEKGNMFFKKGNTFSSTETLKFDSNRRENELIFTSAIQSRRFEALSFLFLFLLLYFPSFILFFSFFDSCSFLCLQLLLPFLLVDLESQDFEGTDS